MTTTDTSIHSGNKQRCWADIDLAAMERNLGRIRAALPAGIKYVAVVKADAYGHGLKQTVARLMQSTADAFAVANVHEAVEVSEIGNGWPILVLSAILPHEENFIVDYKLIPTISTLNEVERFNLLGRKNHCSIPVHLKVDTGMGRLGVWHEDMHAVLNEIRKAENLNLRGIYTHFSCADSDPEFTVRQRNIFLNLLKDIPEVKSEDFMIHADNSAGLETFSQDSPINAVRIGLLQFGLLPYPDSLLKSIRTEAVMSFKTRVGIVKELPAGNGISYGKTYTLKRKSTVAVLTAGYGDGIPTSISNKAEVLLNGKRCPVIGRVTMDQTIVDVTDNPGVQCGDVATIIGKDAADEIKVSEFASWATSIPWEIFCSITKRVPRVYYTDRSI